MNPNDTLRTLEELTLDPSDEALTARKILARELFTWIQKRGQEPDWSQYRVGAAYYRGYFMARREMPESAAVGEWLRR